MRGTRCHGGNGEDDLKEGGLRGGSKIGFTQSILQENALVLFGSELVVAVLQIVLNVLQKDWSILSWFARLP